MTSPGSPSLPHERPPGIGLTLLFAFLGFVLAAALDEDFILFGIAIGVLLGEHWRLRARLKSLETGLARLARQLPLVAPTPEPPVAEPAPAPVRPVDLRKPAPPEPVAEDLVFDVRPLEPKPEPEPEPPPSPTWTYTPTPREPDIFDKGLALLKAYFTGGNPLVRLGVVVLFFGVAFLLRYAAERAWIPLEVRLAGVALFGAGLLGLGWRLRERQAGYGLVLQGGGIGIIYLTVFAAFRLYNLLPAAAAFPLLLVCTVLACAIAVLQNSQALAVFGIAGGFLAPVLASTGQGSHVTLFSYYLLLNAGVLGIAWFKAWRPLNLVGFVFTFGIASVWGYQYYQPYYFASTEPFLILFFLFYVAIAVLFATRQPPRLKGYVDGTLVFGVPLVAFMLQAALVADYEDGLALSALALGAFYLGLSLLLLRRTAGLRVLAEAFLAVGVVFVSLAIPLGLEAGATSALWALEGAGLVWIGVRQQRLAARLFGVLLQLGAGMAHTATWTYGETTAFLNGWYLGALLITVAALFSSYYLERNREVLRSWERFNAPLLFIWGLLHWLNGGLTDILRHLPGDYRYGAMLLFWALTATLAAALWQRLSWEAMRWPALALGPLLGLLLLLGFEEVAHPFTDLGWLGWPLALVAHYWILYRFDRQAPHRWLRWWHTEGLLLVLLIAALEVAWVMERFIPGKAWEMAAWGLVPTLCGFVLLRYGQHLRWPLRRHVVAYLKLGGMAVAAWLWLWLVGAYASGPAAMTPLPYLPLLNPLDLAAAYALVTLYLWLKRVRLWQAETAILLGGTVFYWLNAILLQALHFWGDVPYNAHDMMRSFLVQASLTVFWSVTGVTLMLYAARRQWRWLWLTGMGLMGVVVAKLFLIDLAATGTVERIVAFMAVGILLLIVGYFAPVPPRALAEESSA